MSSVSPMAKFGLAATGSAFALYFALAAVHYVCSSLLSLLLAVVATVASLVLSLLSSLAAAAATWLAFGAALYALYLLLKTHLPPAAAAAARAAEARGAAGTSAVAVADECCVCMDADVADGLQWGQHDAAVMCTPCFRDVLARSGLCPMCRETLLPDFAAATS